VALGLVGRRGRDYFARRGFEVRYEQVNLFAALQFDTRRRSPTPRSRRSPRAGRQRLPRLQRVQVGHVAAVVVERLLPIPRLEIEPAGARRRGAQIDYLYEPTPRSCSHAHPAHVEVQVFRALLESNAAFYAAQMTAMDAATRNAAEMIEQLTLYMNKVARRRSRARSSKSCRAHRLCRPGR
jgi:F-type H+-transporting ATPase subunit gamma